MTRAIRHTFFATSVLALAASLAWAPSVAAQPVGGSPVTSGAASGIVPPSVANTNRVVITWAPGAARAPRIPGPAGAMARLVRNLDARNGVYEFDQPLGEDAPAALAMLAAMSGVERVEPDRWFVADALPNDPRAGDLWGLQGPANGSTYGIDALGAWSTSRGDDVVVAVVDTGIINHPDLAGHVLPGYDMIGDPEVSNDGGGRDSNPSDPGDWGCGRDSSWHGSHVAGTIAAIDNNATGVFGGAPDARILPVRVLGTCGGYETDVADGIRWAAGGTVAGVPAVSTPARVINLSLGGEGECSNYVQSAITNARANGAVVVVAAGNDSINAADSTPANCSGVLVVAAIDVDGRRASFSNYGATIDVAAPGVGIWSTIDSGSTIPVGATYGSYNGTSMAAPHVAVAAAIVLAAHPTLDPSDVEFVLADTAKPVAIDNTGGGCAALGCGDGVVNVPAALDALETGDTTPPAVTSFVPESTLTGAVSVRFSLHLTESVAGLTSGDFTINGTSTAWAVSTIAGSGATYAVTVGSANPTVGTLIVRLKAGSVVDGGGNPGPASQVTAATVSILPFTDIAASTFRNDIVWIFQAGLTFGCGPRIYCPNAAVTRAQMASFLARALDLTGPAPDAFADDETSAHEADINLIAREGITTGCGGSSFCPDGLVTREQMASFLARSLDLTGFAPDAFADDETSAHEADINRIARDGIAAGCGPTTYCPTQNVTRGQMAAFLRRSFD